MRAFILAGITFVLTLGGIWLGTLLRRSLPRHHLNEHAKDVVRLGVGLIAAIAALVLGLLIGAAKGSFDTQTTQVNQITANVILLDRVLEQYGPETRPIRRHMRNVVHHFADQLWREKQTTTDGSFQTNAAAEQVYSEIYKLSPQNEAQRSLQSRAGQVINDLAQVRFMLFAESENLIPTPFLAILAFWLMIVFASYSMFSPLNLTLFTCLSLFAFSSACAIF